MFTATVRYSFQLTNKHFEVIPVTMMPYVWRVVDTYALCLPYVPTLTVLYSRAADTFSAFDISSNSVFLTTSGLGHRTIALNTA